MPPAVRAIPAAPYVSILPYACPVTLTDHLRALQRRGLRQRAAVAWLTVQLDAIDDTDRHAYLSFSCTLPDGTVESSAKAVLWQFRKQAVLSGYRTRAKVELAAGQHMLAQARARLDIRFGFLLEVLDLHPIKPAPNNNCGIQYQNTLEQLIAEGIAERNRALPSPAVIQRIAVIAPKCSAGLEDFLATLSISIDHGLLDVQVIPAIFQGPGTVKSMRHAFAQVAVSHALQPLDLVVVLRGGGAAYDLAWLNTTGIARCVAHCPAPVWSGIGHQRDRTAVDDVAHTCFGTPSKVATAVLALVTNPDSRAAGGTP